jgi:CBS-domain-containing membrane protein
MPQLCCMIKTDSRYYPKHIGLSKLSAAQYKLFKQSIESALKRGEIKTEPVVNKQTGIIVHISKRGLTHSLRQNLSVNKLKSFTVLREILRSAVLTGVTENTKKQKGELVYYFTSGLLIDGVFYLAKCVVKVNPENNRYYHHDVYMHRTKIKPPIE